MASGLEALYVTTPRRADTLEMNIWSEEKPRVRQKAGFQYENELVRPRSSGDRAAVS